MAFPVFLLRIFNSKCKEVVYYWRFLSWFALVYIVRILTFYDKVNGSLCIIECL